MNLFSVLYINCRGEVRERKSLTTISLILLEQDEKNGHVQILSITKFRDVTKKVEFEEEVICSYCDGENECFNTHQLDDGVAICDECNERMKMNGGIH